MRQRVPSAARTFSRAMRHGVVVMGMWGVACDPPPDELPAPDAGIACLGTAAPSTTGSAPVTHAALQEVMNAQPIAGFVVGAAHGDVTYLDAFGDARPRNSAAATPDTPFLIASSTKLVVATLALQLVELGALDLDVDVGLQAPALAGVRNPAYPDVPITPRMLLTHTSTLWDVPFTFDATYTTHGDPSTSLSAFVQGYFDDTSPWFGGADMWWTDAAPGQFSCYSNMGIGVVGALIEQLEGRDLDTVARAQLFEPLGMGTSSFFIAPFCDADTFAVGSRPLGPSRSDGFVDDDLGNAAGQPEGHPEIASGMLRTTAHDMLRFIVAIANGGTLDGVRILEPATTSTMLTRQLADDTAVCGDGRSDPAQQALGFTHFPDPQGTDWAGHYGGMNGFTSSVWFDPAPTGLRYVVLMNQLDVSAINQVEIALLQNPP